MREIKFEWDETKNQINRKKHGIDFQEAKTVFYDDDAIVFDDPEHFLEEERFLILGISEYENYVLKKQITINIDNDTINFFKEQREDSGIPYQTLINLYLSDCAKQKKRLQLCWE